MVNRISHKLFHDGHHRCIASIGVVQSRRFKPVGDLLAEIVHPGVWHQDSVLVPERAIEVVLRVRGSRDRKSTRLNSSHLVISYAVFCLKKKTYLTSRTCTMFGNR